MYIKAEINEMGNEHIIERIHKTKHEKKFV